MSIALMFTLGLAGSLHCVQMCGPLVLSFGLPMASEARMKQFLCHGAYHLGRMLTYALLGAVAGWIGSGMTLMGAFAGIQNTAAIVGGVLMIVAGLAIAGAVRSNGLVSIGTASRLSRLFDIRKPAGRLLRASSRGSRFVTGMVMGLLPCGLIYAALLRSVAGAAPLAGALNMAAFAAGTAGPLLGLGVFSAVINRRIGLRGPSWAAAGVVMMGVVLIWRGLVTPVSHMHHMH
jgi:sulfite exporter TauE/SafE